MAVYTVVRTLPGVSYFPEAVAVLRQMVERFVAVLDCLRDTTFIDPGSLDQLSQPGHLGAVHVGGIDLNRPRARAVIQALLAPSPNPAGFTSSEFATKVVRLLNDERYSPSRAAHDLRKVPCKGLVTKIPRSRRYRVDPAGLRAMAPRSCSATRSSALCSQPHPPSAPLPSLASLARWTDDTKPFIKKCEAPSAPSASLEPHRQLFHDV
jgi:hypothetical protein